MPAAPHVEGSAGLNLNTKELALRLNITWRSMSSFFLFTALPVVEVNPLTNADAASIPAG